MKITLYLLGKKKKYKVTLQIPILKHSNTQHASILKSLSERYVKRNLLFSLGQLFTAKFPTVQLVHQCITLAFGSPEQAMKGTTRGHFVKEIALYDDMFTSSSNYFFFPLSLVSEHERE